MRKCLKKHCTLFDPNKKIKQIGTFADLLLSFLQIILERRFPMPLHFVRNDITKMKVDCIVNAANSELMPGGGVCGAIYKAAGYNELLKATSKIGHCEVGHTVATPAFNLNARYIFHTVGPIWLGGNDNEKQKLTNCYETALKLAIEKQCESIAFPLISSGIYGYPKEEAFLIAKNTILNFLQTEELSVYLVLFDKASTTSASKWQELTEYIDDHYVEKSSFAKRRRFETKKLSHVQEPNELEKPQSAPLSLPSYDIDLSKLEDTFQQRLFRLIDQKGMDEVDVYKRANISRKHFSKIRSNIDYQPKKNTVLAFAIALELPLDDTLDLLRTAGYTLSLSKKFDYIVLYFIEKEIYDIHIINEALFDLCEQTIN